MIQAANKPRARVRESRPVAPGQSPGSRHPIVALPDDLLDRRLLSTAQVAALMSVSKRAVQLWDVAGLMPPPVLVPGLGHKRNKRWRADELARWIDAGCPAAKAWAAIRR